MFYFWVIIYLTWNKSGGNIAAIFLFAVLFLLHLIVVSIFVVKDSGPVKYSYIYGLLCGLALSVVSFYLLSEYRIYRHKMEGGNRVEVMSTSKKEE